MVIWIFSRAILVVEHLHTSVFARRWLSFTGSTGSSILIAVEIVLLIAGFSGAIGYTGISNVYNRL